MIVFRRYDDQTVSALNRSAELAVLQRFAGVIRANRNLPDVDQFSFDIGSVRCFSKNKLCRGFSEPALARGADNDREENGTTKLLIRHRWISRSNRSKLASAICPNRLTKRPS